MEIEIQLAGIQLGPYSEKQIRDYLAEGLLSLTDKAREQGSPDWIDVSELIAKLPPPPKPKPPPDPDAVFVSEEHPLEPATAPAIEPESGWVPLEEPKRAPDTAPGVSHLPPRGADPDNTSPPADALTAKTKPLGPLAPTAPVSRAKGITASKSVSTTAPLIQGTKKMSRTALARALQNKTEPMPSRSGVASSSPMPPSTQVPAVPAEAPETTGPMAPGAAEPVAPSAAPVIKKSAGLSLLQALTAKTVPMRSVTPASGPSPIQEAPSSAPPVPGDPGMPATTPLPTRAIMNPAANRANRPNRLPQPVSPPATELEKPTEKLPISKKAAELRAKAGEKNATTPPSPTVPEPDSDLEPGEEPAPPKRRFPFHFLIYVFGLLLLVGGYYLWSPYHASATLGDGLRTGNAFELDHTVDFSAVRDGLKQQVQTLASSSSTPSSQASADAATMLDNSIDLYVTASSLSRLVTNPTQFPKEGVDQAISPDVAANIVIAFVAQPVRKQHLVSATEFVLETDVATMHLTLQGFNWKLTSITDINVPAGTGDIPAALAPIVQTYLNRGQDAVNNSDWKSAIAEYTKALALDPRSTVAYNARGLARQSSGDLDGAIKDFTQALTIDPQMAAAYSGRGNVRMAKNDLDGAIADFTQAVTIDPSLATAYDSRGNAKTAKDDLDGAIRDFTQAITIDPNLASAYSDRGFARQANGNLDGAIKDYTDALNLKPKTAKTYFSRGLAWLSQNNLEAAILDFDRALAFDPKIADAYFQRGNAKSALHDIDGAIADFTQTLALNPKNALAYSSRGVAREEKGDLNGALADYTQSLNLDPKIAIAYFRRSLIEVRENNPDGAIADASQAIDLDPKNTQAYYYRGFAKLVRGNYDGASSDLRTFCDAAPRDRFANNARLYLWLIAKLQNSRLDADQDLSDALENSWNNSADDFTAKSAAFLLGRVTESDYLTAASSTDAGIDATQHCQAWYFAGMKRLLMGDKGTATDYFQKCVATGKKDFCEYILAQSELPAAPAPAPAPAPTPAPPVAPPTAPSGAAPPAP